MTTESCWRTLDEAGCAADKTGRIREEIIREKLLKLPEQECSRGKDAALKNKSSNFSSRSARKNPLKGLKQNFSNLSFSIAFKLRNSSCNHFND